MKRERRRESVVVGGGQNFISALLGAPAEPEKEMDIRQINREKKNKTKQEKAHKFLHVHGSSQRKTKTKEVAKPKCSYASLNRESRLWKWD